MSKSGQNNFRGIEYQAQAALLLFLLKIQENDFESITLEDAEWEDFTLNYASGKKTICESKFRNRPLRVNEVQSILQNIIDRHTKVDVDDEILIITPQVTAIFESDLEFVKYFPEQRKRFIDLGFTEDQLELLAQTSFFIADSSEFLYQEVSAYFYSTINYWLPQEEVDGLLNTVLVKQIYAKSTNGEIFSRSELIQAIDTYRRDKIKQNGVYDVEQTAIKIQMKTLLDDIKKKNVVALKRDLIAISSQPQMMFIALDAIAALDDLQLSEWDFLWKALIDRQYAFRVVHIFDDSLDRPENARYVIDFLRTNLSILTRATIDSHSRDMAFGLIEKVLRTFPNLADVSYETLKTLLRQRARAYRELETRRDYSYEKEEIAKSLKLLMDIASERADEELREKVADLAATGFDLVSNDGEFFIHTPSEIFAIFEQYNKDNFPINFERFISIIIEQFNSLEWYKKGFSGWELSGGTSSQWGDNYSISDRHFISRILKPILDKEYQDKPEETWQFIIDRCITQGIEDITAQKPDFLNRATIDILLAEYEKGQHSNKALEVLKDFIKMRRGIPHKAELIFQAVRNSATLSDNQKWVLVEFFLSEYQLPWTVFVEQTVADLATKGHEEAILTIASWIKNPDYHSNQRAHSSYAITILLKLLTSSNQTVYIKGTEILKDYLAGSAFKDKLANWDTYDVSKSVLQILEKEPVVGIEILKSLYYSAQNLTDNQQTLISNVIEKINENRKDLLKQVYDDFVCPILINELKGDIREVEKKFTHKYAREYFVQYADKLAKADLFEEALTLVKLFINDTNPTLENNTDDPEGSFNYHEKIKRGENNLTITTVRGWCAWVLQKFSNLKGRDYLTGKKDDILLLVRRLVNDPNYYVRTQGMIPLIELVKNRHAVMPKSTERFLPMDKALAIENLTFELLESKENQRYPVIMKHLAMVLTYMRNMKEKRAMQVLTTYRDLDWEDSINDIASLYIFFAEFRKTAFTEDIFKTVYGEQEYKVINNFNDQPFKELLEDILRLGKVDLRSRLAWQFWRLPEEDTFGNNEIFPIALHYLMILSENYVHHVFEYIYHFIEDWLDKKPEESISLWKNCITIEKQYLTNNPGIKRGRGEWWPNHYNGHVLVKIKEFQGNEEFLKWFGELINYPESHDAASGINEAIDLLNILIEEGFVGASDIRQQLIAKQPHRYEPELDDKI